MMMIKLIVAAVIVVKILACFRKNPPEPLYTADTTEIRYMIVPNTAAKTIKICPMGMENGKWRMKNNCYPSIKLTK